MFIDMSVHDGKLGNRRNIRVVCCTQTIVDPLLYVLISLTNSDS